MDDMYKFSCLLYDFLTIFKFDFLTSSSFWIQNVPMSPNLVLFTFIDLNPDDIFYYPFIVSLDRYHGSCNTVRHLFVRICFPKKTKNINLNILNMITGIIESKT